ncbi:MAG: gliding motility protein GldM [Bacteroidales bacterium]|nr:gliding motility protein GldM [Bacteroidales bacterium]MCF8345031.1 gliding motility protein GldM [Bacteroidales bacterium]MCF8351915.1 gliding motility protein GldM [Bacteroidales bacterium]MCF8376450.1 gliding motility protein GldM [Bacteroidales bacterium]MCF8400569.1 gliding motility protein GldM [Bacteroidales bacterium]
MAGYKETPRQKMIAMMYLVLTALLALNVSKEMLDAFVTVNESVEKTKENFSNKIDGILSDFTFQYSIQPEKVDEYYKGALHVREKSEELINYIDSIKYAVIVHTDRKIPDIDSAKKVPLNKIQAKDRYSEPTNFFFGNDATITHDQPSGQLKKKIIEYRNEMLGILNEPDSSKRLGLRTEGPYYDADGSPVSWEMHNFYYTILAADVTILNKLIAEVQNAEFDVLNALYASIDETDFKFNKIDAKVIADRSYILQGEKYIAEVFAAAYDTILEPEVYLMKGVKEWDDSYMSRAQKLEGEAGMVELSFEGAEVGTHPYAGIIQITNPATGKDMSYEFSGEYIVAPPSLTVAATKMNVFYIGVDNPVSISAPGIAHENIHANITAGGELNPVEEATEDGHNYVVRVGQGMREAVVSATALIGEDSTFLGSRSFRVKRVPDPVAEIAGVKEGTMEKNTLLAAGAIIPEMKDFEFDLYFYVTSFQMGTIINGDWIPKRANSNRFTDEMINIIRDANRGQKFFFENIQADGDDGTKRTLNAINLTIK